MDTITQGLLGAATAQLGFRQRIGRDATWVAAFGGILPDLDIFVAPLIELTGTEVGPLAQLRYHRGLSHSLLFAPVMALVLAGLWWRLRRSVLGRPEDRSPPGGADEDPPAGADNSADRPAGFWWLFGCAFVAIFTHPLLDWTTSYGTRLLTPLTDTRFTIDSAPIVDLIYTSLLVITLATCYVVRRVRGGHARKATLAIGWTGVMLTVAYLAAGRAMHDWAVRKALTHDPAGKVLAVNAYPMIGTIFLWRTVMETDQAWIVARFHHFDDRPPEQIPRRRVEKQAPARWVEQVMDLPAGRTWKWFTNGQVRWEQRQVDGVHVVEMHDMRYGPSPGSAESLWWLRVEFDSAGEVQRVTRERHFREGDFGELVRRLWRDIWQPRNPEPETLSALMISRDDAKDLPHANPAR